MNKDSKKCAIIIQARMSANRFPQKMTASIAGIPLVEYIYNRCRQSSIKNVMVATTDDSSDDVIYNYCKERNIPVSRGDLENVLKRYIKAADSLNADYIVRVCGDTPFVDINLMERLLETLIRENLDYVSINKQTCASAFLSEAMSLNALKKVEALTKDKGDLEHVTKFIIENQDKFLTRFIDADLNPSFMRNLRLTIDYPEDIQGANIVINELNDKFNFISQEVLDIVGKKQSLLKEAIQPKALSSDDFPQRIEFELASACNLRCTYCPRKHLNDLTGFMNFDLFKNLTDQIVQYPNTILVLHRRGESLLHPDFIKICNYVKGKVKEIQIATNATLLDDKKAKAIIDSLNFISFSIDIPEVFDKTRIPAKYKETEAKILRFLELNKGKLRTQVSMVSTVETPSENAQIFKDIWQGKVDRIRIYEEHSRDGKFGSLKRDRGKRLPCTMPFYEMLIFCDGKVGRCNHDWNGSPIGNVKTQSIKEIWENQEHKELRRQHIALQITDKVCKNCSSWYPEKGKQKTGEVIE